VFSLRQRGSPKQKSAARTFWLGLLCSVVCSACFAQAPANDNFTNAIVLYGSSTTFSGTLSNATFESGERPDGCNAYNFDGGGSVWWSWTATNSTTVVIDVLASTAANNAGLSVHTGADVASVTDLDCSGLDLINRYIRFAATAGTTYHLRLWGLPGSFTSSFTFRLTATTAPVILAPPQAQTVAESASVMFGVIAGGFPPLKYQWQFAGNELPGQTAPTLVLHYLAGDRAGGYSVVVTNSGGVTTSAVATLTISPIPPLLLAPVNSPDKNYFSFSLAGETGRLYRVWATTNLVNWMDEESLNPDPGYPALVLNTNATSVYSIPIVTGQKFLRASHYVNKEICIAQLQAIDHAKKFWAIEVRHYILSTVTEQDITPYLKGPVLCPSGGTTFADSYSITDVASPPLCQKVPALHVLPP